MFVVEFLLKVNKTNKNLLDKKFKIKEQMINVLVKHYRKQLNKLKKDTEYNKLLKELKTADKVSTIKTRLAQIRESYDLSKGQVEKFIKVQQHKYKNYISSQEAQVIANDVWTGIEKILFDDGKKLHFKKFNSVMTLSSKSLENGTKLNKNNKLICFSCGKKIIALPIIIKDYDDYGKAAYQNEVKYCRLVRKQFNNGFKYYVQLIMDGTPPLKHVKGNGTVGVDVGVSSVAADTDTICILEDLSPKINKYNKKIIQYQKQLERSRRLNNPDCYNSDGTIKKGVRFKNTKNYIKTIRKIKTIYRKHDAYKKEHHAYIANKIIENGDTVFYEDINFKALQKRAKELARQDKSSIIKTKTGTKEIYKYKKKKRFGKSLGNKSPSAFVTTLKNKCIFYNIKFIPIEPTKYKASQFNHQKDEYIKKELKDRWNELELNSKKVLIQRDLYSAFLLKNPVEKLDKVDIEKCNKDFSNFVDRHNKCIEEVKRNNNNRLSCFGF